MGVTGDQARLGQDRITVKPVTIVPVTVVPATGVPVTVVPVTVVPVTVVPVMVVPVTVKPVTVVPLTVVLVNERRGASIFLGVSLRMCSGLSRPAARRGVPGAPPPGAPRKVTFPGEKSLGRTLPPHVGGLY